MRLLPLLAGLVLPHVQVVPLHATLQVKSSDPILHNVHSFLNGSSVINFAMPA
jgi:hypothetical protein